MRIYWWIFPLLLVLNSASFGAVSVSCELVQVGSVSETIPFSGEAKPIAETMVTPDISGRVEKVLVENGQSVKAGEPLILLDKERLLLSVKHAETTLKMAEQTVIEKRKDYERKKILFDKKVLNEKAYEEAETEYVNSQSAVKQAQTGLDMDKLNLERSTIRSAIQGFFVNRQVNPGQGVAPGQVLGQVVDLKKVFVEAKIPELSINQVKVGQETMLETGHMGKVAHINLYGDESRSFLVKIQVENPDQRFKANMFVKGQIIVQNHLDVPLVPIAAVLNDGRSEYVFLNVNQKAVKRQVTVRAREGKNCFVEGINVGDSLIIEGTSNLGEGDDLNVASQAEKVKEVAK